MTVLFFAQSDSSQRKRYRTPFLRPPFLRTITCQTAFQRLTERVCDLVSPLAPTERWYVRVLEHKLQNVLVLSTAKNTRTPRKREHFQV
jgi:hypothetical protein